LEAAKGKIKEASEQFRKEMENNNYDEAEIQLDNIIAVQNTRTDNLNKLSTDIDALISLLQTALTNAATVSEKPSI
jgi:membrane-anchored protein YejM (alkaline phosphatase superfamily)